MKTRLISGTAALGCLLMASCYPIQEGPRRKPNQGPDQSVTSQNQQKIQDQRDKMKQKAEAEKTKAENSGRQAADTASQQTSDTTPKPPVEPKRAEYQFADPVPGRPGFVLSPYNKKIVDVRDIPSGTLVQDPTYPAEQKKYFRVP
ncbi:MAG: hypothetical protein QM680_03920 [Luteolibacter sp.]